MSTPVMMPSPTDRTPSGSREGHALEMWMYDLLVRLFPICRSLAGPGNRETLQILAGHIPVEITEVPTGTQVFDWVVPDEWTPRSAEITGPDGVVRARFEDNNLHLVSHSEPIEMELELDELREHIFSLPDQPDLIPYVTRYYQRGWGFCMSEREKAALPQGKYRVRIDADLEPGALTYGEAVLPGESSREVLVSTYICHPSMANDNLSGVVTAAALYRVLSKLPRRHFTYRFLFVPETIGSIAWLWNNRDQVRNRTAAGFVLSCVGDDGPFTWKETRLGNTAMDRIMSLAGGERMSFTPVTGSDERQFCSSGFDLPVVMLARSYPGSFSFYHTSADTPERTSPKALGETLDWLTRICETIDANAIRYRRVDPHCEPMLSRRGLYHSISIRKGQEFDRTMDPRSALMWVLSLCDGDHDLASISERSGIRIKALADAAALALEAGLLEREEGKT